MKYKWQIKSIENKLNAVTNKQDEFQQLKYYIYSSMLTDISSVKKSRKEKIDRDEFFLACSDFDEDYFDSSFFRMVLYLNNILKDIVFDDKITYTEKKDSSFIISLCRDFYKHFDKHNLPYFRKIISNPNRINIVDKPLKLPAAGRSYIISNEEYYILINGINFLQDSSTLIHESKHVEGYMKSQNKGIPVYQELPSYVHEMYHLDYLDLQGINGNEVESLRRQIVYKYVCMIKKMADQIDFIIRLANDVSFFSNIYENYDLYYSQYGLEEIYYIFKHGYSKSIISHIVSFVVGTDIYINTEKNNLDNILSCYIFGIYHMKPGILDGVVDYIKNLLDMSQNSNNYSKIKNLKNSIDK